MDQVEPLISNGEYWKARQIFQTRLGNVKECDREMYYAFANLLKEMHEDLEAGKYFFISGKRGKDIDQYIDLFFSVHTKRKLSALNGIIPASARIKNINQCPDTIKNKLIELKYKEDIKLIYNEVISESVPDWVIISIIIGIIGILLISVPVGLYTIVKWIFGI